MSFHSWLQNLRSALAPGRGQRHHRRRASLRAATYRPNLEALEDRCLLAFIAPVDYDVGLNPAATVVSDFNNDGRLDFGVANSGSNTVSVLLGDGDGAFQAGRNSGSGPRPQTILAGDLNGDTRIDLVTVNRQDGIASSLSVLLGNGDGLFQAPRSIGLPAQTPPGYSGGSLAQTPYSSILGDLNADGRLDLVAGGFTRFSVLVGYDWDTQSPIYEVHIDGFVNVLLGNGDGTFGPGTAYHIGANNLAVGDFDGDGKLDVVTDAGGLTTLLGNGDGTLQTPRPSVGSGYYAVGGGALPVADFDLDGKLDLLMRDATDNAVVVMLGNGDGTFRQTEAALAGGIHSSSVGDVNADRKPDIVVLSSNYDEGNSWASSALVLLGNGDGTFAVPIISGLGLPPDNYFKSAVLADFDGDGYPDLAGSASDFYPDYDYQGLVAVAHNDGLWTLPPPPPPTICIGDVTVVEDNTGTRAATFTVTLSAASSQTVTIDYTTADGSATAGSDYQTASGTLTIPAGQMTGTIIVLVNVDRLGEANETFVVNLSSPTNATITDGQGVGTIADDEPRISISDVSKAEGKRGQTALFTFTVTLSAAYDQPVTMSFHTVNGTAKTSDNDYIAKTGTLTFAPGETTKTITIEVKGDGKRESSETFYLDLLGNSSNSQFTKNRGIGTILNDD